MRRRVIVILLVSDRKKVDNSAETTRSPVLRAGYERRVRRRVKNANRDLSRR